MKKLFPLSVMLFFFACSGPEVDLKLEEIKLAERDGNAVVIGNLKSQKI